MSIQQLVKLRFSHTKYGRARLPKLPRIFAAAPSAINAIVNLAAAINFAINTTSTIPPTIPPAIPPLELHH
jgi:hypothetical protein